MNKELKKIPVFILYIFSIFLLPSCGGRPSYVLPEDKMVSLLVDMELTEAYLSTQTTNSGADEKIEMGERVLAAHGVSEETLDTTLAWYGRNMDKYTVLYEKVDKELLKRKKKYTEIPGEKTRESGNLWPYSVHLVISPFSGYESLNFIFPATDIEKGDQLHFSLFLPNAAELKSTFGVEYSDGYGEAVVSNFNTKNKIEFDLQTDSTKTIKKIFGSLSLKDDHPLPLYIDSINIKTESVDTLNYRNKRRTLKGYGIMSEK